MKMEDSHKLVLRAQSGEEAAVESLLQRFSPGLAAFVRHRAGPLVRANENPSDLVQSVCREVLEDLSGFRYEGEAAFKQWLYKRALHKIVDRDRYYRAEKRGAGRVVQGEGDEHRDLLGGYQTFCTPSKVAMGKEAMARIERAFDRLPEDYREVILLSRIAAMSHDEIAERLGRTSAAVRTLLSRALARLSTFLDEEEEE